jgi:membrane-bound inhibitor of C-type lysozyme
MRKPRRSLLVGAGCALAVFASAGAAIADDGVVATARYRCTAGRTIEATYYPDKVSIALSDGRSMTLPQTMSGSGVRYAAPGDALVFWNKGRTAFVTEGTSSRSTYAACVQFGGR